jgi:YidC/Oxa1 family membrane protein insertase
MFTTLIVQPIFNLLVLIYTYLPGHNFGLSIILFTIVIRMLLLPLLKKQLHQTKVMRKLAPEIKRIKAEAKGNKQKESTMTMELYKERGINPFSSIGVLIIQLPILIALYSGLRKVVTDPNQIIKFAYPGLQHTAWMKHLATNIHLFDRTLFGVVDLTRAAIGPHGIYWPAMVLVIGSATIQYFQSKQLLPQTKESQSLRTILKQAGEGKQADQTEVSAAVGRSTRFLIPAMIFLFTVNLASALSLYWLIGGLVAFVQQSVILREDETEMEAETPIPARDLAAIPEAEVIETKTKSKPVTKKPKPKAKGRASTKKKKR